MAASFLHGVETIEITKGARTISTVKTAVVGIVGTAPLEDVADEYKTINTPTLILNEVDAVKYFGNQKSGYTIPQALQAIFDQGSGIAIVINVFDPEKHETVEDVTIGDINGTIDPTTGKRTGLKAFEDCYSLFGYYPKTIIAPVFCEDTAVVTEISTICNKIRAMGIVDAPVGASVQDIITGRGPEGTINFNTSSGRIILCYPHLKVYDAESDSIKLQPYSQRLAGVIAAKDVDKGYHWSPSNTEIQGIVGIERQLTESLADMLEEMVQDAIAVIPDDSSVEIQEANKSSSAEIFEKLINKMNAEISKAILGQTLTTEIGSSGSYAASNTHMSVRQDIIDTDRKLVESVINQLIRWIYELNSPNAEVPVFEMYEPEDVDLNLAQRDKILFDTGVKFTKEYFIKNYGLEDEDFEIREEVVIPPSSDFKEFKEKTSIPGQEQIEELYQFLSDADLTKQAQSILAPLISLFESCESYEEAYELLSLKNLHSKKFEETLQKALFLCELQGRSDGLEE